MGAIVGIVFPFVQHHGLSIPAVCLMVVSNLLVAAWAIGNRRT